MFTGSLDLINVTLSGNTSTGNGGGICAEGAVTATNITVTDNESTGFSAGGIRVAAGTFDLTNSIVAGNRANMLTVDFSGTVSTSGYNIIGNSIRRLLAEPQMRCTSTSRPRSWEAPIRFKLVTRSTDLMESYLQSLGRS